MKLASIEVASEGEGEVSRSTPDSSWRCNRLAYFYMKKVDELLAFECYFLIKQTEQKHAR